MDHVKFFRSKILLSIHSALHAEWESSTCIKIIRDSPPDHCSLMGPEILHSQAGYYISHTLCAAQCTWTVHQLLQHFMLYAMWGKTSCFPCKSRWHAVGLLCSPQLSWSLLVQAEMAFTAAPAKTEAYVSTEILFVPRVSASKIRPSRQ